MRLYGIDGPATKFAHPALLEVHREGVVRDTWVTVLSGVGAGVEYKWFRRSHVNMKRALMERLLVEKGGGPIIRPAPQFYRSKLGAFTDAFSRRVHQRVPSDPQCIIGAYKGRKRARYAFAFGVLERRAVRVSDSYISAFPKKEKQTCEKVDPVPRFIGPRGIVYNADLARYLKFLEHDVYTIINRIFQDAFNQPMDVVMKGKNAREVAENIVSAWSMFADPVAISLDCVRFDSHVSLAALRYEHSLYDLFYNDPHLRQLLRMQLRNKIFARTADGFIKATVDGCRMSGDMNTAMGNVLLMCGMMYSFLKEIGIQAAVINNGDDCLIILERSDLGRVDRMPEWFAKMGFPLTVEQPVDYVEGIEFCQGHPVYDGSEWVMVRNFPTTLSKDAMCITQLRGRAAFKTWCTAISDCGLALAGGIPVYDAFYRALNLGKERTRRGRDIMNQTMFETGFAMLAKGMARQNKAITDEARASFARAFDCCPAVQLELEKYYRRLHITHKYGCEWQPASCFM